MWARFLLLAASVACAAASPSHCIYTIAGENGDPEYYDFSSLATSDPWMVPEVSDSRSKPGTLFLSMCGPLKGLTKAQCPDEDASACLARQDGGNWRSVVPSAAVATANYSLVRRQNFVLLVMPGHTPCGEPFSNYSISINLICNEDQVSSPFFIALVGCEIQLAWMTSAACPSSKATRACSLVSSGGYWLDLYPLTADTAYNVTTASGRRFYLNLCTPVAGGLCPGERAAACEINANTSLAKYDDGRGLQHTPDGRLIYTQLNNNGSVALEVEFLCNQTAPLQPEPEFVEQKEGYTIFSVYTPYACFPTPIDCVAYTRQGMKIDLSPLRKTNSYWTVRDPRANHTDQLYYINVCAPLARSLPSPCHAGNVGACVSTSNYQGESHPLGVVDHPPRITKDGDIILTYRDGSFCPDGKNRRKTNIIFKCNEDEKGPAFMVASDDCVFTFLWNTPAACEPKPDKGDHCRVLDSRMLYSFDVRSIYNDMEDYEVRMDSHSYRVNLCGPLHKPCNGVKNVNVCLVMKNGTEIAIGLRNDRLEYSDGRLSLSLQGQECLPGVPSSITAILACEHDDPEGRITQPHVFASGAGDCHYYLVWNHPKACPPYKEVPCSVQTGDGTLYDLSSLSRRSTNHIARTRTGQGSGVVLNVCRSVVFNRDANCETSSGACLRHGDKFINLGNVQSGPFIEGNMLKLRFEEGALCHAPRGPVHVTTTITFLCDPDELESQPEYVGEFQCDHALFWRTAAACPQRLQFGQNCSVRNPATKFRFDLSPLAGKDHTVTDEFDQNFILAVCSDVSAVNHCPSGSGACLQTKSGNISLGRSNPELRFSYGGTLELRYKSGDACGVGRTRETIIEFFCGAEGSLEGPRVVEVLQGCITIIHWHTRLACEQTVACSNSVLGFVTDLSPLIRVTQNYRAELPDGRIYFLNVCRPLVPQSKLNCGAGAAACVARKHPSGKMVEELSLGYASTSPTITAEGALLIYSGGTPCPRRPSVNASTRINFKCDPYGVNFQSGPIFEKESPECQYSFTWHTSLVCGPTDEEVQNCGVYVSQLKRFLSLDSLGGQVEVGNFTIDLCGKGKDCSGNAVCQRSSEGNWASYGILQKSVLYGNYLKLYFGGGASCMPNKTYGAEVWLGCDKSNGTGAPKLLLDRPCYAIFEWRSDALCLQRQSVQTTTKPDVTVDPALQESMPPSHSFLVAMVILLSLAGLTVAAVFFVRRRYPLLCLSWRLPWPSSASHTQVHYSRETLSTY